LTPQEIQAIEQHSTETLAAPVLLTVWPHAEKLQVTSKGYGVLGEKIMDSDH
jgi:hypothetical protein